MDTLDLVFFREPTELPEGAVIVAVEYSKEHVLSSVPNDLVL